MLVRRLEEKYKASPPSHIFAMLADSAVSSELAFVEELTQSRTVPQQVTVMPLLQYLNEVGNPTYTTDVLTLLATEWQTERAHIQSTALVARMSPIRSKQSERSSGRSSL